LQRVDYNQVQYRDYARGRALQPAQLAAWQAAFAARLPAGTRAAVLDRLRLRTFSVFAELTAAEAATGFERLEAAVATDPDQPAPPEPSTLLTLIRPHTDPAVVGV
jgi:hypothetical protein